MSVPRTYTDKLGRDCMVDGITLTKCDDTRGYDRVKLGESGMMRIHTLFWMPLPEPPDRRPPEGEEDNND